jgi:hypothetical protein
MVSVPLRFIPPDMENLVQLKIFESPTSNGTYTEIETVTNIGVFPNYIEEYTTDKAASISNWFAIQWVDNKGAVSEVSAGVQGSSVTAVGEIASRVELRDSALNHQVVVQEAEAAIERYIPKGSNVYATNLNFSYQELRGLTNLTLAMCYLTQMVMNQSSEWVAGIVSMKTSDAAIKSRVDSIKRLIAEANIDLGLNFSMIAILEDIVIAGGTATLVSEDQSRLLIELR